jgi:hypothetical protein
MLSHERRSVPWNNITRARLSRSPSFAAVLRVRIAQKIAGIKQTLRAPTLLRRGCPWLWVCSECRLHREAVAFVPLPIRSGLDASSDRLRLSARCGERGTKGLASLQHRSVVRVLHWPHS